MNNLAEWTEKSEMSAVDFIRAVEKEQGKRITYKVTRQPNYWDKDRIVTEEMRLFVGNNGLGYFPKGKRTHGYCLDTPIKIVPIIKKSRVSEEQKFDRNMTKIINMLNESGLWENIRKQCEFYRELGYELCQLGYKYAWSRAFNFRQADQCEQYLQEVEKAYTEILNKVNTMSEKNKQYFFEYIDKDFKAPIREEEYCHYIKEIKDVLEQFKGRNTYRGMFFPIFHEMEYLGNPKIVKMRFQKSAYYNEQVLERIKLAMKEHRTIHERGDNGYDVSFEYNADIDRAWYSCEYRGCGNGHYYLALNHDHAIYYEKD